jgi:hypothetical protein
MFAHAVGGFSTFDIQDRNMSLYKEASFILIAAMIISILYYKISLLRQFGRGTLATAFLVVFMTMLIFVGVIVQAAWILGLEQVLAFMHSLLA